MWEKIVHIFGDGLAERLSGREEFKRVPLARTLLSQTTG
jgi:hypothetical protein